MIRQDQIKEGVRYGAVLLAIWVGWEVVKAPIVERAAPALALRLAPSSPEVLRRSAESELLAERPENAEALARASLSAAPFNARSLRVLGLAKDREGDLALADELLTLAGNWSLRDDPSHAWLVERRLRQGSYSSAFAHADTLARRRDDTNTTVFNLFVTAALQDQRAIVPLAEAVSRNPPWRQAFFAYMIGRDDAVPVILTLATTLVRSGHSLSRIELQWLYQNWFGEGRLNAMRYLANITKQPDNLKDVQNGDFSIAEDHQYLPFGWGLVVAAGISPAIMEDDVRAKEKALRVEYDGYAVGEIVDQTLVLPAGRYVLRGEERTELAPKGDVGMRWSMICVETGRELASHKVQQQVGSWRGFAVRFDVPTDVCVAQRLRLVGVAGDRRDLTVSWFDKLALTPIVGAEGAGSRS